MKIQYCIELFVINASFLIKLKQLNKTFLISEIILLVSVNSTRRSIVGYRLGDLVIKKLCFIRTFILQIDRERTL